MQIRFLMKMESEKKKRKTRVKVVATATVLSLFFAGAHLMQEMDFLNHCLVKRTRFPHTSAEKAWSKFHHACQINLTTMSTATGLNSKTCFHICLKTFDKLIHEHLGFIVTRNHTQRTRYFTLHWRLHSSKIAK